MSALSGNAVRVPIRVTAQKTTRLRITRLFVVCGLLLDKFTAAGNVTGGYTVLFLICAFAYVVAFALNHLCAPSFEEISAPELAK